MSSTDATIQRKRSRMDCFVNDVDRISYLPDDIMSHILSSLPTVDAVATCVLSKCWVYKWTCIYNIDIDDRKRYQLGISGEEMFLNFMNRLLLRTQNVKTIRLKLMYRYNWRVMNSWLSDLLRNKMETLYIDTRQQDLLITNNILNSISLGELMLVSVTFKFQAHSYFSNLTNLCLEKVEIVNEISGSDTMHFNFPVLEVLKLLKCKWSLVKLVEICAPVMKTFVSETKLNAQVDHYYINIHGAGLTKFRAEGGEPENISLSGSKVVYATLQNIIKTTQEPLQRSRFRVQRLFREFSSTLEELTLSLYVVQVVMESRQVFHLLRFDKLERLILCSSEHFTSGNTEAVLELLHTMPFLKYLVIDVLRWDYYDYDAVESIPSCIVSSLEEIEFVNITCKYNAIQLAKFLLKTAVNLKKFQVDSLYEQVKVEIVQDIVSGLSAYPTVSTCLKQLLRRC